MSATTARAVFAYDGGSDRRDVGGPEQHAQVGGVDRRRLDPDDDLVRPGVGYRHTRECELDRAAAAVVGADRGAECEAVGGEFGHRCLSWLVNGRLGWSVVKGGEAIAVRGQVATMLAHRMSLLIYSFEEAYRRPCDVRGLLEFFAVRALPGVEVVDPERLLYRRTIDLASLSPAVHEAGARPAVLQVDFGRSSLADVQIRAAQPETTSSEAEKAVARGVRRLFDLDAHPDRVAATLGAAPEFGSKPEGVWRACGFRAPGTASRPQCARSWGSRSR